MAEILEMHGAISSERSEESTSAAKNLAQSASALDLIKASARCSAAEAGYFCFGKSNQNHFPQVLSAARIPSPCKAARGFADGTSLYRGERSSSLTRPLRGQILTDLQGEAATEGINIRGSASIIN